MSLLRVIWLWTWDLADMTYTVTPGAIYSVLEPTLGGGQRMPSCYQTRHRQIVRTVSQATS